MFLFLAAVVLIGAVLPPISAAAVLRLEADTVLDLERIEGRTRYLTAIETSKQYAPGVPGVVLATGANFPDALCAAPLAGAYAGPILLVPPSGLTTALEAELVRLNPQEVFIVGGPDVVSTSAEAYAETLPSSPQVSRLAGRTRYETSARIVEQIHAKLGDRATVVVATGLNFPDALAAAPFAAANGWPILLSKTDELPSASFEALAQIKASSSIVVGGAHVVSDAVKAKLPNPIRLSGANRYETCAAIAEYASHHDNSFACVAFATGENFPDALAAGPLIGAKRGMLLLAKRESLPSVVEARLISHKHEVAEVDFFGGENVLGTIVWDRVEQTMFTILKSESADVGGYISFSPSGAVGADAKSQLTITAESRPPALGAPEREGGGLYSYDFWCRDSATTFYLTRLGNSSQERVDRNTFVDQVVNHRGELDPLAVVTSWAWIRMNGELDRVLLEVSCNVND